MNMKLALLLTLLLTNNCEAQLKKFETAVAYNDYIVEEQLKIGKMIQEFNNIFGSSDDTLVIHKARIAIKNQADSSVKHIKLMQPYKGDTALKKATISLFSFYAKAAVNEYTQLLRIFYNTQINSEEKRKQLETIIKTITDTEAVIDKNFADAQKAFAAKHGFTLTENDFKIKNE
jgi:hypothetical protein